MDIVKIIRSSVESLPDGEYMPGLRAIQKHIEVAIKHFEREDDGQLDSFTDAIYRCNQAFEGALKEAYRVLAKKDPSKLTPHKIESYIEEKSLIRPRALKQLTRYREDYRNPSTHDYKLDFDEDEALLAIVSVCAFTKLLINQIATRIAFEAGKKSGKIEKTSEISNGADLRNALVDILRAALNKAATGIRGDVEELNSYVAGALTSSGFTVQVRDPDLEDILRDEVSWNIIVSHGEHRVAVEARAVPECDIAISYKFIENEFGKDEVHDAILIVSDRGNDREFETTILESSHGGLSLISPKGGLTVSATNKDKRDFSSLPRASE